MLGILKSISEKKQLKLTLPKRVITSINSRLCKINQRTTMENMGKTIIITGVLALIGAAYFSVVYYLSHAIWYHKVIAIVSAAMFTWTCKEIYFEILEKRIREDLPELCRKLAHYYTHYKGNLTSTLEDTIENSPESTKVFVINIRDALKKPDFEKQVRELQDNMPNTWLKVLSNLLLFAKDYSRNYEKGTTGSKGRVAAGDNVIAKNLKRLRSIITHINIEQGYNDAELMLMEISMFVAPLGIIMGSQWFNSYYLLKDLNMSDIYSKVEAQGLAAIIILVGNIGAVFLQWVRRLQHD